MRILLANDDGVYSPGLLALARCARRFGEVQIYAPDVEQSSMGHAITHSRPLRVKRTPLEDFEAFRVNGTPADCVAVGLDMGAADVVLSGINLGPNLGNAMWHSGTLSGARQASLLGMRGIALSVPAPESAPPNFELIEPWIASVLEILLAAPDLKLVNVNFPAGMPRGILWTRQSVRHYDGKVVPGKDPMGRTHYWFTVVPVEGTEEDTDRWAFERGYVSMTPLRLDLTDEEQLAKARGLVSLKKIRFA